MGIAVMRWGIYQVDDALIRFLPEEEREPHTSRFFVVITNSRDCASSSELPYVLGCPTSTQLRRVVYPWDVELPGNACGTSEPQCWIKVTQLQGIEKRHLTRFAGEVPTRLRTPVMSNIVDFLDLIPG
ncbi:PemK-like protein [Mycobacteroides abscessus subsp. abscessus]|nr:type II toxin-antitoxin system PemK/MazF family toxin [Mycobacteroides abscessus subsp. abscessus]RIT96549.1 hypothetical protein D2F00_11910 [Mycobacteroides abscessus]SHT67699.1 PemK-like protein [Mycobacteroides abscessus subsp. abscessus]SHW84986.1 PemK-like protein [Mycobacteroides abscessus subsp. abscessus]SHY43171.1 PemK-like protein [Mycobacteroides abscessus subsp. abscessus]